MRKRERKGEHCGRDRVEKREDCFEQYTLSSIASKFEVIYWNAFNLF